MFRSLRPYLALFVCLLLLVSCSSSTPSSTAAIWDEYVESFRRYQNDLYQFGADRWPKYEPVLKTQRDYQRARIKLRDRQFQFLMDRYPDQLPTNWTVHDLIHFEWNPNYDTELFDRFPETRDLSERVSRLREQSNRDDQWPELRERFRALPSDSEYHSIKNQYQQRLEQLARAFRNRSDR